MACNIVKKYYAKVLHTVLVGEELEDPTLLPGNQYKEYGLVHKNIKAVLKDGLFMVGGKDEQVSSTYIIPQPCLILAQGSHK